MGFQVKMAGDTFLDKEINGVMLDWKTFKREFIKSGKKIRKHMIEYIKSNSRGTSNATGKHLHQEIDISIMNTGNRVEIGIGDIDNLTQNAPWWAAINFGMKVHPVKGWFIHGRWTGNKFTYDKNAKTGMRVINEIHPMNYIENTEHYGTAKMLELIKKSTTNVKRV